MFTPEKINDILRIKCGTEVNGQVFYTTTLYYYRNILIDTGCPNTVHKLKNFISGKEVKAVLLTHYHEDHAGGAFLFENVYAPEKSLEVLRQPLELPEYRQIIWGQPKPVNASPLDEEMEFDDVVVEVIDTPGHSFDHVSFLINDKLFIGDVIGSKRVLVAMKEEDYKGVIDSVKKILSLDFEKAYGGHVILTKEEVEEFLNYLVDLKVKVEELSGKGRSVSEIVDLLLSDVSQKVLLMEKVSNMEWARVNLIRSLLP
jgi:glyoxylase-like metal-dependent hydrolase (beta-lactamase superfamily II)